MFECLVLYLLTYVTRVENMMVRGLQEICLSNEAKLLFKDFGSHVPTEELAIWSQATIPKFETDYSLNIPVNTSIFKPEITFLRVEYINSLSKVTINFEQDLNTLIFKIHLPFLATYVELTGYAELRNKPVSIRSIDRNKEMYL